MAENTIPYVQDKRAAFDWKTAAAVVFTILTWASAFAGIRAGLKSYAPEHLALLRYLTASLTLLIAAVITRMSLPGWRELPAIIALGAVGISIYNIALNIGERDTAAAVASMIIASGPIFVVLFAGVFLKERLTRWAWAGIGICFAGVMIISFSAGGTVQLSPSAILILAAAVSQALYITFQKPMLKRYTPFQFTTYAIWGGTFLLMPFFPGTLVDMKTAHPEATLAVVYMGVFPAALGYVCWSYVLSRLTASRAGVFLYTVPPTAALIAWVWLGEIPTILTIAGGLLVLCGVIVVNTLGRKSAQVVQTKG